MNLRVIRTMCTLAAACALGAAFGPSGPALGAAKPALGKSCTTAQIGKTVGTLVCTRSGKTAVWRKAPVATTTTVLDSATAPAGTVLARESFDDPATSTWARTGGDGWSAETRDGQYRITAAPPAPGRIGLEKALVATPKAEWAFDVTVTPGAQSKASFNLSCQDTGTFTAPYNFLLIDVRNDGRLIATRYDNNAATQPPTTFFDLGFSNANRFDPALLHARTRVSLRCLREGTDVHVVLSLDGTVVMDTTTKAPSAAGDSFMLYLSTFTSGFRDAAELSIDNSVITKL